MPGRYYGTRDAPGPWLSRITPDGGATEEGRGRSTQLKGGDTVIFAVVAVAAFMARYAAFWVHFI